MRDRDTGRDANDDTDRKPLPYIRPICLHDQTPTNPRRRRTPPRVAAQRPSPESTLCIIYRTWRDNGQRLTDNTIERDPNRPTIPPPRLRSNPHLLRPQTKQPHPPSRNPNRPPPRTKPPNLRHRRVPRPRKPPLQRPLRHRRLPRLQPRRRRGGLHA